MPNTLSFSPLPFPVYVPPQVVYDDGDEEHLRIGLDCPVLLDLPPDTHPDPASADYLGRLAGLLQQELDGVQEQLQSLQAEGVKGRGSKAYIELRQQGGWVVGWQKCGRVEGLVVSVCGGAQSRLAPRPAPVLCLT